MSHFINKCSCGEVIAQCRCPSQDKTVTIIENGCEKCKNNPTEPKLDWKSELRKELKHNPLCFTEHQIDYLISKLSLQKEHDARVAESKKVVGDFAPKETMKILGITQEDIQHELDIRNQACDDIASSIREQEL